MIRFTIPGEPCGKQRPRVFQTKQGKSRAITPQKTVNYETLVKWIYSTTCNAPALIGAVRMEIKAYYPIPKSTSQKNKKAMLEGKILHTKRGDLDNIIKIVADALNGIAYKDDGQIAEVYAKKMYSDMPRVEVTLQSLDTLKA